MPYSTEASHASIEHDFTHHVPTTAKVNDHATVRYELATVAHLLDDVLPPGREKSLARTKLEEAMFWANAAIARHDVGGV